MGLSKFTETFVEGFEEYIQNVSDGNASKLLNLRDEFEEKAISYYDEIAENALNVTYEDLINCIEVEKEKRGLSRVRKFKNMETGIVVTGKELDIICEKEYAEQVLNKKGDFMKNILEYSKIDQWIEVDEDGNAIV